MSLNDIETLVDNLNNFTLDNDTEMTTPTQQTPQVAQQTASLQLLRLHLDVIPNYDGNPHTMNIFLEACQNLVDTFGSADVILNNFLVRAILGKLTGRAMILIGSRIELKTWDEIKISIKESFGDQRNLDCLVQDLIALRPQKNETPYNFGMRCQDARSLITSKLNCCTYTEPERKIRQSNYDELALKTFIRGLPPFIQNNVRLRDPDKLEKAMSLVIEEENFLYTNQRQNTLNMHSNFKPAQRIVPTRNPNINHIPQQSSYNNIRSMSNNTPFQQRPLLRPPQITQTNQNPFYRTNNNSNFRPPQFAQRLPQPQSRPNQFIPLQRPANFPQYLPRQNPPQHQQPKYQPEPMDTSSGHSRNTRMRPQQNFTATQLFTQKINNICENPTEYTCQIPFEYDSYENLEYDANTYENNDPYSTECDVDNEYSGYNTDNTESDQVYGNDEINFSQASNSKNPT